MVETEVSTIAMLWHVAY